MPVLAFTTRTSASTHTCAAMSRNGVSSPGGGAGAGRTANNSDYFVDTKLLFRLKRFVTEQQERGSLPTEDAALDYLLDKFKEYVRKPQVCTRCMLQMSLFSLFPPPSYLQSVKAASAKQRRIDTADVELSQSQQQVDQCQF